MDIGIGSLVKCVIDPRTIYNGAFSGELQFPQVGGIYTVRNYHDWSFFWVGSEKRCAAIWLEEIINVEINLWNTVTKQYDFKTEAMWLAEHFRPVKRPSIEILRKILTDVPKEEVVVPPSTFHEIRERIKRLLQPT